MLLLSIRPHYVWILWAWGLQMSQVLAASSLWTAPAASSFWDSWANWAFNFMSNACWMAPEAVDTGWMVDDTTRYPATCGWSGHVAGNGCCMSPKARHYRIASWSVCLRGVSSTWEDSKVLQAGPLPGWFQSLIVQSCMRSMWQFGGVGWINDVCGFGQTVRASFDDSGDYCELDLSLTMGLHTRTIGCTSMMKYNISSQGMRRSPRLQHISRKIWQPLTLSCGLWSIIFWLTVQQDWQICLGLRHFGNTTITMSRCSWRMQNVGLWFNVSYWISVGRWCFERIVIMRMGPSRVNTKKKPLSIQLSQQVFGMLFMLLALCHGNWLRFLALVWQHV